MLSYLSKRKVEITTTLREVVPSKLVTINRPTKEDFFSTNPW